GGWTGDSAYVTDVSASTTSLTMPGYDVSVAASYLSLFVTLKVNYGVGSGEFSEGEIIAIRAASPPVDKVFDQWTGDISGIADVYASSTMVTIGTSNIAVTATYRNITSVQDSYIAGSKTVICFPNPASADFSVDLGGIGEARVEIYNLLGRLVYSAPAREKIHYIDDPGLKPGVYLVKVSGNNGDIYIQKLMIEQK
ncbi:T9SS type A sorting domain-containing protein, partial [Bacteroidota bacterium]